MVCIDMFFPCFLEFLDKNPPCCIVLFVSVGRGAILHVFLMVSEIFCIIWSIWLHACCHCSWFKWFSDNRIVISFNWIAFSSKNLVLNFSRFSCGMGFFILVV